MVRFGVCAPVEAVATLPGVTFDYLEAPVQGFLQPERPDEEFARTLRQARELPIPVEAANSLLPGDLALIAAPGRAVDVARLERYMRTALARAEQAGIRVIVFGSGVARQRPDGVAPQAALDALAGHLERWGAWAGEHGVTIVIEPLRYEETNIVNTVAEGADLARRVHHPNVALLADTYHMACNGEAPESLTADVPLLAHVHTAERQERAAPGRHGEDLRPYFRALRAGGYDARISIECTWTGFAAEVAPSIAALRAQWEEAAP